MSETAWSYVFGVVLAAVVVGLAVGLIYAVHTDGVANGKCQAAGGTYSEGKCFSKTIDLD